jgi:hypothetical protein
MAWAPEYVEVADLAAYVGITDDADDAQLALVIAAASRAVDRHCRRQFGLVSTPEARYYTPRWDTRRCQWVVNIDDLQTTTGLAVAADLDDSGDYSTVIDEYAFGPVNAQAEGRPWTALAVLPTSSAQPHGVEHSVKVTARFGWTVVPPSVKQATLLQGSRLFKRADAPFGIAGPEGAEMRLLAKVDPDVAVALEPYRKRARPR